MPISPYLKRLRGFVGTELLLVPGAAAIIHDADGRVLLQRRSDTRDWGVIGGATDPGEQPAQTLVREAFEETGLRVRPLRLLGVLHFGGMYPNGDKLEMTVSVFRCEIVGGELAALDGESLELEFFLPDALPPSKDVRRYPKWMFEGEDKDAHFNWDEAWLVKDDL